MKKYWPWLLWGLSSILLVGFLTQRLQGEDKSVFLPGQTSVGHYQIELECDACHGESFTDAKAMQKNCEGCHSAELKAVKDSHPKTKFTDPRNADRVKVLDARYCVTCHSEHKPEITAEMGVSLAAGFCIKCHDEIAEDRPSHQGMAFESCDSAGCHNYHDNRALYEDFLVKHAGEPEVKPVAVMPTLDVHQLYYKKHPDKQPLTAKQMDAPEQLKVDSRVVHDWSISSHAEAGVNCSGCHQDKQDVWVEKPAIEQCRSCHQAEADGFVEGRHGMRLKQGLTPMQPKLSRLQLNPVKADRELTCTGCHDDHEFDSAKAAVEACMSCHQDEHTRNYKNSPHYQLWRQAQSQQISKQAGVSCATCHMPVSEQKAGFINVMAAQHNQNLTLRPNEKMIRKVCLNCHSLAFSIDALADEALIQQNFDGRPSVHIESIDMALEREK